MQFLLDANLPYSGKIVFEQVGYTVEHVRDLNLQNAPDAVIASWAQQHKATLVTRDLDFANILRFPPKNYFGIIVLRLDSTATATDIKTTLGLFIQNVELLQLEGSILILEPHRWRLRRS